jgi:flagellar M-ring protein FliF
LSDAEKEQINNLVRDAVGFDQKRGDSLNVQIAPFTEDKVVMAATPWWQQPYVIELAKDISKYLLIAAAIAFIVFGIIKPAFRALLAAPAGTGASNAGQDAGAGSGAQLSPGIAPYEQNLQVARKIAQQEPKIVASVIKEWVKE